MLGLRPRLKARPSFLDLVRAQSIDRLSVQKVPPATTAPAASDSDGPAPALVPLPESPTKEKAPEYTTTSAEVSHKTSAKMPPKKQETNGLDEEKQYGSIFSISGQVESMLVGRYRLTSIVLSLLQRT